MSPISTFARCSVLLFGAALFAADSAVAIQEDNIQLIDSGEVDPNSSTYLYAPKVMFDTLTGEFKFWGCGGVAGDFIIYKASTVFENLDSVVWHDSLHPSYQSGTFDKDATCDPTVYEHNGRFYLQYTGINLDDTAPTSRIGAAVSEDRGQNFVRLFSGAPIFNPTTTHVYGAGQSSVVRGPDGLFYMLYSDLLHDDEGNLLNGAIHFVRSPVPSFPANVRETIASYDIAQAGGVSLDLAYNRGRGQFEVIANWQDGSSNVRTGIVHFDRDFTIIGSTLFAADTGFVWVTVHSPVSFPAGVAAPVCC